MAALSLPAMTAAAPMTVMRVRRNRLTSRRPAGWLGLACVLALAGCESVSDIALDPAATEADWRARTLETPELADFLCRHGCSEAAGARPSFDLRALTLAAIWGHPDLRVAAAQLAQARAAITTAGASPNPTLTMEG